MQYINITLDVTDSIHIQYNLNRGMQIILIELTVLRVQLTLCYKHCTILKINCYY